MPTTRSWALLLSALSFFGWSTWELARPARSPLMDLSNQFTDHASHMNAARVFTRVGLDVWRKPLDALLPRPTREQAALLPADVFWCRDCLFVAPGWKKPVLQSWSSVVRFYPPGDMVLTAPVAALYHFTDLSATNANRLLLVLILACAHLGIFVLLDGLLAAPGGLRWHTLVPMYLGIITTLHWSLEGFYDVAMIAPLLLSWRYLGQKRGLAAGVAFCAAAFLHFRAYYYAPWALYAGFLIVREKQWRAWRGADFAALGAGALLGAASLLSYFLAAPGLFAFNQFLSPLLVSRGHVDPGKLLAGAVVAAIALAAFVSARSWLDVLLVPWIALILMTVRQTMPWYMLAIVPWLCALPRPGREERAALVFDARVLVFLFRAIEVHLDAPLGSDVAPGWLARVFF